MTNDEYTMTTLLKGELGFDGFCLTDYDAIPQAGGARGYDTTTVPAAVNAGVDMAMIAMDDGIDGYMNALINAVDVGRIDDAVRRILRVKVRMDLFANNFEKAFSNPTLRSQIWSAEHQELAREAVRKSLVLLKNDNAALPLSTTENVVLAGPFADMMGAQAGGWTVGWQGMATYNTSQVMGETLRQGFEQVGGSVTWSEDASAAAGAGKVVVVIGENPYAEGYGDHGSRASVYLSEQPNYEVLTTAIASGAQVVLVLISGRPLIIEESVLSSVDAIVAAWLPGSKGVGVADVLYGNFDFTGTLTHTWPASFDQIPVNVDKQPDEPGFDATEVTPLFPVGHGLTY
jgi:beta-glucosidase